MTRVSMALAAIISITAVPVKAQDVYAEPFSELSLAPGGLVAFGAHCEFGDLVSGGYRVHTRPDVHSYSVEANYPETAVRWTIQIRNISDRPIEIGGVVYAVCLEK